MPIITVKVFEGELTWSQMAEMVEDITKAVIPFVGEALRSSTQVLVEEVKSGAWESAAKPSAILIYSRSSKTLRPTRVHTPAGHRGSQPGKSHAIDQH